MAHPSGQQQRWMAAGVFAVVLAIYALALGLFVADHRDSLYDDAYIYWRYADHAVQGCGLRFNCADAPVEGFTSPLYLAFLTGGRLAGIGLAPLAYSLGFASTFAAVAAAMLLGYRLARAAGPWPALATAAATALALGDHLWLLGSVTGLESPLAALTVTLLALALVEEKWLRTAVFLAWLARPEAAVFGLALLLHRPYRSPRWLAPLAGAVIGVELARWGYFGDWLPNTARAKAGGSLAHLRLGMAYLLETAQLFPLSLGAPLAGLAAIPWSDPPPELLRQRQALAIWLLGALIWLILVLAAGGDHFGYGRLLVPLVPAATAMALAALARAMQRLGGPSRWLRAELWPLTAAALLAGWGYAEHRLQPSHGFDNVGRWQRTGEYLGRTFPNARVATVPIGAMGYFSGLHIIDLVGLTQPEIARGGAAVPAEKLVRTWIGHEREHTAWVLAQRPDVIALTRYRATPWLGLHEARAGFWAEWKLLREVKEGRAPYVVHSAQVEPGLYGLLLVRREPEADLKIP